MMKKIVQPVRVIDDFFEAPHLVRHSALKLDYIEQDVTIFPGLKSSETLDIVNIDLFDTILIKLIPHVFRKSKFNYLHCEYNLIDKTNNGRTGELRRIDGNYNIAGYIFLDQDPLPDSGITMFSSNNNEFVPSIKIENKFNRCVLFDPAQLHKVEKFTGNEKQDSSLAINFYGVAE